MGGFDGYEGMREYIFHPVARLDEVSRLRTIVDLDPRWSVLERVDPVAPPGSDKVFDPHVVRLPLVNGDDTRLRLACSNAN
jgi:hypothetical protein